MAGRVTAVGDSVMLGAKSQLAAKGVAVYAQVSFQFRSAGSLSLALRSKGALGSTVLIHLGTNGPWSTATWTR